MSMQDPIADMLTRIRNAQAVNRLEVIMPASNIKKAIAQVLLSEGYILAYEQQTMDNKPVLKVVLKYHQGKPVIERIKRLSKPGLRRYCAATAIPEVMSGLGIIIVSTSKGIVTGRVAKEMGQGGEMLCSVE